MLGYAMVDPAAITLYTVDAHLLSCRKVQEALLNSSVSTMTGYYVTFWQGVDQWGIPTGLLHECYSPCAYTLANGRTYYVSVADYGGESFTIGAMEPPVGFAL